MFTMKDLRKMFQRLTKYEAEKSVKKVDLLRFIYKKLTGESIKNRSTLLKYQLVNLAKHLSIRAEMNNSTYEIEHAIIKRILKSRKNKSKSRSSKNSKSVLSVIYSTPKRRKRSENSNSFASLG